MSSRRPRLFFFFGFLAFFALRPCLPAAAGAACGGRRRASGALRRGRAERRRGHEQDLRPRGQHADDEPHELVHAGAHVLGGAGLVDLAVVRAEHEHDVLHRAVALDAQRQRLERGAPVAVAVRKGRCAADQAVLRDVIPVAEQGLQHAGIANVAPVAVLPVGREAIGVAVAETEDLDHAAHLTSGSR